MDCTGPLFRGLVAVKNPHFRTKEQLGEDDGLKESNSFLETESLVLVEELPVLCKCGIGNPNASAHLRPITPCVVLKAA